jgi:hypothetical protein
MARSGDTYTVPAGALTWASPAPGDTLSISGWNALLADIVAALSQSLRRDGGGTMSGQFKADNGSAAAPGIAFASDTSSGLYRQAANVHRYSIAGVDVLEITATALKIKVGANWRTYLHSHTYGFANYVMSGGSLVNGTRVTGVSGFLLNIERLTADFTVDAPNALITVGAAGVYRFKWVVCVSFGGTGTVQFGRTVNNGTVPNTQTQANGVTGTVATLSGELISSLNVADTVGLRYDVNSGTPNPSLVSAAVIFERIQ